jgi:site-specific DNA-methyltransferase (adenine-specific)
MAGRLPLVRVCGDHLDLDGGRVVIDLRLGDCLEILPTLADKCADAILTDLPYGTTACGWDVVIPFAPMWEQVRRLLRDRGAFVTTASQPFASLLIASNLEWFKYEWIWQKDRPSNIFFAKTQPMKYHENVLVFSGYSAHNQAQNKMNFFPQMELRKEEDKRANKVQHYHNTGVYGKDRTFINTFEKYMNDEKNPGSIQRFNTDRLSSDHPTQKPVALYEYLIQTYTNPGDTVLDFCMGSGTTGVACVKLGRNFIGIEKEPKYYEIAERRIKEAQQQMVMEL